MTGDYHLRGDHLNLIARSHVRNSLRSGGGVIFLILSMLIGIGFAAAAILPIEAIQKADSLGKHEDASRAFNKLVTDYGPGVLRSFTNVDADQATYLLRDKPALVTVFLVLMIFFMPFLAALSGFNQTSGDIGSKGLRYFLLRTERGNIFLGRLIGTYLFTLAVIAIIFAVFGLYLMVKVRFYPAGDVTWWLVQGFVDCAIYVMPWVAFCAWISASVEIPFLVLVICELGLLFWTILVYILKGKAAWMAYAGFGTPWGWKWWLFDPSIGTWLGGAAAMLGFTALFTWMGLRTFHRRDL